MGTPPSASSIQQQRLGAAILIALLGVSTVAAILLSNGNLAVSIAPCAVALLVWTLWVIPLRVTLFALIALAWVLENFDEQFADGRIDLPWKPLGTLLWTKLNVTVPVSALVFSGFDLILILLLAAIGYRHYVGSRIDRTGWMPSARPLQRFALLSLAAAGWMFAYGLFQGGVPRFAMWQVYKFLYLPFIYFLMNEGLRGPVDAPVLGRLVLGIGVVRSVEALVARFLYPSKVEMPFATTHHDSVLFAVCLAMLAAAMFERPTRRMAKVSALLAPLFLLAMHANNRRLVWTEVGFSLMFIVAVTPWGPVKRRVSRVLAIAVPVALLYVAIGWNSNIPGFGPVRTLRTLVDEQADASTMWREIENHNLIHTYSQNPVLGLGFGREYFRPYAFWDITDIYPLENYVPHNSVLGLWAFGGLIGFYLLWVIFPVGMFFAVRAYRWSRTPIERITSLTAAVVQICYLLQAYGDLGFGVWGPVFLLAASYAMVGKICVANGAWPLRVRSMSRRGALAQPLAPSNSA